MTSLDYNYIMMRSKIQGLVIQRHKSIYMPKLIFVQDLM
mgnify:CR=1 FL=1